MLLIKIILSFMKISCLAFGGAYAAIPLVEREIVVIQQWMTYEQFANLVTLDELTPGPIILNCATFVGMNVAGIPGAIAATLGSIIPPCIISFILIMIYKKYKKISFMESCLHALKCMAIALILSTFIKILMTSLENGIIEVYGFNALALILIPISFVILRKYKFNPVYMMLVCGVINLAVSLIVK